MKDADRRTLAAGLARADVLSHWRRLFEGDAMADWGGRGYALEYLFLRSIERELDDPQDLCWPSRVSGERGQGILEQIDGVVYLPFAPLLIEAKCETEPVDVEPLAKLRFRLEGRPPGTLGLLVSTSGFTKIAAFFARFASPLNIILWTREDLAATIETGQMLNGLRAKWRAAVEQREALLDLGAVFALEAERDSGATES